MVDSLYEMFIEVSSCPTPESELLVSTTPQLCMRKKRNLDVPYDLRQPGKCVFNG
jgi:hypothetical protein